MEGVSRVIGRLCSSVSFLSFSSRFFTFFLVV